MSLWNWKTILDAVARRTPAYQGVRAATDELNEELEVWVGLARERRELLLDIHDCLIADDPGALDPAAQVREIALVLYRRADVAGLEDPGELPRMGYVAPAEEPPGGWF